MKRRQLKLNRETLLPLATQDMHRAGGAGIYTAQQTCFCSHRPTCPTLVSCPG